MAGHQETNSVDEILENEVTTAPSLPGVVCPHCEHKAKIRNSVPITLTYRDIYYVCQNVFCAFSWKMSLGLVHGISPSASPKPGLELPMYEPPKRALPAPKAEDRQQKFEI